MKISASHRGKKMSPEAIAKMKATKAANLTPEVRERIAAAQRGKKQSEETRRKRSERMLGHSCDPETRAKIANSNRGKVVTEEQKEKIRAARATQTNLKYDHLKDYVGRPISEETRQKYRDAQKRRAPISEETRAKMRAAKLGKALAPGLMDKILAIKAANKAKRLALKEETVYEPT